ncbi:MAG: hypothetical protein JRJ54_15680 [Deltaproteobacteria bacterium]|nr:hypothetical protein [Deltaproteobacteria bacterium]
MKELIYSLIISLFYTVSFAHTIILKNGSQFDVNTAWEEDGKIKCEMYGAMVAFPKEDVSRVIYTEEREESLNKKNTKSFHHKKEK